MVTAAKRHALPLVLICCLAGPGAILAEEAMAEHPDNVESLKAPGETQAGGQSVDTELRSAALLFVQALLAGVPEAIVELAEYPFNLDGIGIESRSELLVRLREAFRATDMSRLPFYGIRILPAAEMTREFGKPPRRLAGLDLEGTWIAVANLGGHGHVVVFKQDGGAWRAIAYSE